MNTRGSSRSEPLLKIIAGQDMTEAMRLIRDIGQYEHSVYHLAHRPNSPTDLPYFKSTYPHSWLGRYIENEYFNIDPVMLDGFDHVEPFFWSKLERKGGQHAAFLKDAFQHGIGCTGCHTPKYVTAETDDVAPHLRRQLIWPYTDLLLHDMGEGLADHRPQGTASGREWRTAPLWGIGLTGEVNGHTLFLHDGRARNLTEAILWHGGEAQAARDAFAGLDESDREALLAFLASL